MARKRPSASNVPPNALTCLDGGLPAGEVPGLTRAEASALRRTTAVTHAQLRQHLRRVPEPPLREA